MHLKIATRQNELDRLQAVQVSKILEIHGHSSELIEVPSEKGDSKLRDTITAGNADIAVYSAKHLAAKHEDNADFTIAAVLERKSHREVVITKKNSTFLMLENNSKIGVSTKRRAAQIKANFPYFELVECSENLEEKFDALKEGKIDAFIASLSDIIFFNLEKQIDEVLESDIMMPALGEGVTAVECRTDNEELIAELAKINHKETYETFMVERAIARGLNVDYNALVAGYCEFSTGGSLRVVALATSADGENVIRSRMKEKDISPACLGKRVVRHLSEQGVDLIL